MTQPIDDQRRPGDPPHIVFGADRLMFGGPFFNAPQSPDFLTINLMAEAPHLPSDIYIPIQDYSIPQSPDGFLRAFEQILQSDKDVYVGCFGGIGRTGLFMSCFLKYQGCPNPLETVRAQYNEHAVETDEQKAFLDRFPASPDHAFRPHRPRA